MDLNAWLDKQQSDLDEYTWKGNARGSVKELEQFGNAISADMEVVSTHTSKSITLPVIKYQLDGISIIARDNFYDIKVSVESDTPIDHDLWGITAFTELRDLSTCYFEGFSDSWVYPAFYKGTKKFSASLSDSQFVALGELVNLIYQNKNDDFAEHRSKYYQQFMVDKRMALGYGVPCVISRKDNLFGFFKLFNYEGILPDRRFLEPMMRFSDNYQVYNDKKTETGEVKYLHIDFTLGCPEPREIWLKVINEIIKTHNKEVRVTGLSPRLVSEIKSMELDNKYLKEWHEGTEK